MARGWMKEAREKVGKTMAVVANELNISESYYCEIENNNRMKRLDVHLALALAKSFKIPVKRILDEESKPEA
jgi:transcriptional regulator with XRE-family HTH domain